MVLLKQDFPHDADDRSGSRIPFLADADSGPKLGKAEVRG